MCLGFIHTKTKPHLSISFSGGQMFQQNKNKNKNKNKSRDRSRTFSLSILFLLSFLIHLNLVGATTRSCQELLSTKTTISTKVDVAPNTLDGERFVNLSKEDIGSVKKDFDHNTNYTKELAETEIKDQCAYGACWAFSTTTALEKQVLKRTGKQIELNPDYVLAYQIIFKALESIQWKEGFSEGDQLWAAFKYVKQMGIVPESVWQSKVDFRARTQSARFTFYLQSLINKYQKELEPVYEALAKFNEVSVNQAKPEMLAERDELVKIVEQTMDLAFKDLVQFLTAYAGELPQKFEFDGKEYTPLEFQKEYVKLDQRSMLLLAPDLLSTKRSPPLSQRELARRKYFLEQIPKEVTFKKAGFEDMEKMIIQAIDAGEPVMLGIFWQNAFVDAKTGIMSLDAFHHPFENFQVDPVDVRERNLGNGLHAVIITGYELGADGRVLKYKIHNSWGKKVGDEGYFHLYRDYFEAFVYQVGVYPQRLVVAASEPSSITK